MNIPREALEIIRQNGSGQDIRCFIYSRKSPVDEEDMSRVYHYRFDEQSGFLKIRERDNSQIQQHEENFLKFPVCKFLINKGKHEKKTESIWMFGKFKEIENGHIIFRILEISYTKNF